MTWKLMLAAAAAAAIAGAAGAQPYGRGDGRGGGGATLYEYPNFQGRSVTITDAAPDLGAWRFNDRAQSARFQGTWRVCEHDGFKGRCQEIRGDVPDLTTYGISGQISSMEPAGRYGGGPGDGRPGRPDGPGGGGGGWGPGGRDGRGVDGTRTVFFVRPTVRGMDVAAARSAADAYCRRQGLGASVWYDSSERAQQAIGPSGEIVGRTNVIRDLLCLKY